MEPLKPDVRRAILEANPSAQPAEIEEYEQLLSRRFFVDPDAPRPAPALMEAQTAAENRLAELHRKLFPGSTR